MLDWDAPALVRTTTVDTDGFLNIQPAYSGAPPGITGGPGGGPGMVPLYPSGFLSRPRDPDVDAEGTPSFGASCAYFYYGDQGYALPLFDSRLVAVVPAPEKGGWVQWADTGNGVVSLLTMSGTDGTVAITVPTGATIRLNAPSGRSLVVSATGADVIGTVTAGVVSADDPGVAPAPGTIAGPLATHLANIEAWALQADIAITALYTLLGVVPPPPPYVAAVAARVATAATIAGVYPGGMTATRLNAR